MNPARTYLQGLRRLQGLTQHALAMHIGTNDERVKAWEAGRNTPTLEYQIKLARVLKTPLYNLQIGCAWPETPGVIIQGIDSYEQLQKGA